VVSPADDDDVSPSAQDEESVFDLPSGPSIKRERTPLTPPETGVFSSNKLRDAEESPLLRKTAKRSGYFGAPTVAAEPVVDVNVKIKLEEDVDFEPRKIFRQQTVVMEQCEFAPMAFGTCRANRYVSAGSRCKEGTWYHLFCSACARFLEGFWTYDPTSAETQRPVI
jgi:hypothetical protein